MSNRTETKRPDSSRTPEAKARTCERKQARAAKAVIVSMAVTK